LKFQFQLPFYICLTSDFDSLPQGEGCRGLVGLLQVGSPLGSRDRGAGAGAGEGGGGVEAGVTSPGGGDIDAGLCRGVNLAASSSGHPWQ